jgi:hypothetical protein
VEAVTTDYIAFHAAARPDALAVSYRGRLISYAALNRTLRAMMRSLSDLSLPQGSRVAIAYNSYGSASRQLISTKQRPPNALGTSSPATASTRLRSEGSTAFPAALAARSCAIRSSIH